MELPSPSPNTSTKLNRRNKVLTGIVGGSTGVALFLLGVLLQGRFRVLGDIIEKIGEFLVLVVTLHFTYDWLVKDFDQEQHLQSLAKIVKPLSDTLDQSTRTMTNLLANIALVRKTVDPHTTALAEANRTLKGLLDHTTSVFYSDSESFEATWKEMADAYETFLLLGDVPLKYLDDVRDLQGENKVVSIYRTVTERNRSQIIEAMKKYGEDLAMKVMFFHIGRFDWGFTVIASQRQGSEVKVLINFNTNPDEEPTGYYVFGNAAVAVRNAVRYRLAVTLTSVYDDESESALPIEGDEMLDALVAQRTRYKSFLNEMRQGIPLKGEEAICQRMSQILSRTHHTLKVTHIAKKGSIELLNSQTFQWWLDQNYQARKRGVQIKRIFLVDPTEVDNPVLLDCVATLRRNDIEVRYCLLSEIDIMLAEDFSIYDDNDLIYISPAAGGAWKEERTEARHSCNPARLERYRELFDQLERASRPFASGNKDTAHDHLDFPPDQRGDPSG